MINLRLRKCLRYSSIKHGCKSSRHFRHEAFLHSSHYSNVILKNVPSIIATRFPYVKNSYSTISEAQHVEDANLVARSPNYSLDHDQIDFTKDTRNCLYPESNDEVIVRLKSCCSGDDALNILFKEIQHPKPEHLVQTLLVFRDLYRFDYLYENADDVFEGLRENPLFKQLTEQLVDSAAQLNIEELSYCILYLFKFNVDRNTIMYLVTQFEDKIKKVDVDSISSKSLCRVCVYIGEFKNIWSTYTFLNFLPIITRNLVSPDSCDGYDNFRASTICLQKMSSIINPSLMQVYLDKCPMLIPKNLDTTAELQRIRTVVRCASFLNIKSMRGNYSGLIADLLLSLHGSLHLLSADDQYIVHLIAFELQEPRQILHELKSVVEQNKFDESQGIDLRTASLLFMHNGSKSITAMKCASSVLQYVDSIKMRNWSQFYRSVHFIHLLHIGRKLDLELSNKYWSQISDFLNETNISKNYPRVIKLCIQYIKFSSKTAFTHETFESNAVSWLNKIKERELISSPYLRCTTDLLLLYFGRLDFLESTYEYFTENISRLKPVDAAVISQILCRIGNGVGYRKSSPFVHMVSALNNSLIGFLKTSKDQDTDTMLNLFRCYSYLNDTKHTELYRLIIDGLKKKSSEELSSKGILSIIPCSYRSHFFEPDLADKMVQYIISRFHILTSYPIIQTLNFVFTFGYTPAKCDEFLDIVSQVLIRDKEELAAPELIKAVLSLCYFNHLPNRLSEYIFNVEFLRTIDDEISSMTRMMNHRFHENFLQLNRAACLDFPNIDTTWFHDRYCRDRLLTTEYRPTSQIHREIEGVLRKLINNDKALQVHCYSPYHHKIDFLLYTNRRGEPVDPDEFRSTPQDLRKTAILVNRLKTSSPYYIGKGRIEMAIRQLEMLEYKVAVLESHRWNSMFMSEPNAKETYLCDTIWSSSHFSNAA